MTKRPGTASSTWCPNRPEPAMSPGLMSAVTPGPRVAIPNERLIRQALHAKYLRNHRLQPDTLVIDELGLAHARSRIDIAVINRCLHGYEIKSDLDTLLRLPQQLRFYSMTCEKMTLVVGAKHLRAVSSMLPSWGGLVAVKIGPRGGISFDHIRPARANPNFDSFMFLHLLWRGEAEEALRALDAPPASPRATRRELYAALVEALSTAELTTLVKRAMRQRQGWRALPPPA